MTTTIKPFADLEHGDVVNWRGADHGAARVIRSEEYTLFVWTTDDVPHGFVVQWQPETPVHMTDNPWNMTSEDDDR